LRIYLAKRTDFLINKVWHTEAESKILVIEDDSDVDEMLTVYFRVQSHDVSTVNWGRRHSRVFVDTSLSCDP